VKIEMESEGKADISTLEKTGHLYFGPTRRVATEPARREYLDGFAAALEPAAEWIAAETLRARAPLAGLGGERRTLHAATGKLRSRRSRARGDTSCAGIGSRAIARGVRIASRTVEYPA